MIRKPVSSQYYGIWEIKNLLDIGDIIVTNDNGLIKVHKFIMNDNPLGYRLCLSCSIKVYLSSSENRSVFCSGCLGGLFHDVKYDLGIFASSYIRNRIKNNNFKLLISNLLDQYVV